VSDLVGSALTGELAALHLDDAVPAPMTAERPSVVPEDAIRAGAATDQLVADGLRDQAALRREVEVAIATYIRRHRHRGDRYQADAQQHGAAKRPS
jgi:hypothetical protein